jgi:hypothetical protein
VTHKELSDLAVKWLRRPNSNKGHGCIVSASELRSGWDGEIPDAIGFRLDYNLVTSVVVEAKASRSDFLADRNKPHRMSGGIGNYRYFICPEGVIHKSDLPAKWGLIWVNARGHIKLIEGPASYFGGNYLVAGQQLHEWRWDADTVREAWLLVRLLSRVGDVEQMNGWIKESNRLKNYYRGEAERLNAEVRKLRLEMTQLKLQSMRTAEPA